TQADPIPLPAAKALVEAVKGRDGWAAISADRRWENGVPTTGIANEMWAWILQRGQEARGEEAEAEAAELARVAEAEQRARDGVTLIPLADLYLRCLENLRRIFLEGDDYAQYGIEANLTLFAGAIERGVHASGIKRDPVQKDRVTAHDEHVT